MDHLPPYIGIVFGLTTLLTVGLFYRATPRSRPTLLLLLLWLVVQACLGVAGFYTVTDTTPPRFLLLMLPISLFMAVLFAMPRGQRYIDSLDPQALTILHIVRIPVEVVLLWLAIRGTVPELMTFEGRNFDILSGLSAPIVYYFGFVKNRLSHSVLILWNVVCLALLINIIVHAILSAPLPFQQLAFDQPNIAVLHFPFNWLPSVVVPLVLFSHLATIWHLVRAGQKPASISPR